MLGRQAGLLQHTRLHFFGIALSPRSVRLLSPLLILVGAFGCAVPLAAPIDADGPIELASNEGLLIIHIDTDIALENLFVSNHMIARSLDRGRHLWISRLPEGSYRWNRFEIGNSLRYRRKYLLESDEELSFEVEAGKLNYPGELVVRSGRVSRWFDGTVIVRNRNHSAMAVRQLRGSYDSILRSFPLHYAGLSGDAFLEYYARQLDQLAAESSAVANGEGRGEARAEAP